MFERIKLFKIKERESIEPSPRREVPRRRLNRFQTQPVTPEEVKTAQSIPSSTYILGLILIFVFIIYFAVILCFQFVLQYCYIAEGQETSERRGILKSPFANVRGRGDSPLSHPRSVLKKRDSFDGTSDCESSRRSILKTDIDVTYDEGISCNDSASDSETAGVFHGGSVKTELKSPVTRVKPPSGLGKLSSETSDGDSSGGREVRSIFKNENKLKVK